jgi:hypothetical protein
VGTSSSPHPAQRTQRVRIAGVKSWFKFVTPKNNTVCLFFSLHFSGFLSAFGFRIFGSAGHCPFAGINGEPIGGSPVRGIVMESPGLNREKSTPGFAALMALSGTP